jgi:hypothetical protein
MELRIADTFTEGSLARLTGVACATFTLTPSTCVSIETSKPWRNSSVNRYSGPRNQPKTCG